MNEKKLNEELSEVEANSVDINEEKETEEVEVSDKKKEKISNKKPFLILLGGFIVFIVAFLYLSGAWNPFKSNKIDKSYIEKGEHVEQVAKDISKELGLFEDAVSKSFPGGLEILENPEDNVLKSYRTASGNYAIDIGLSFTMYAMKNEDYAKERYTMEKAYSGMSTHMYHDEKGSNKMDIIFSDDSDWFDIYVKDGSCVYIFIGKASDYKNPKKFKTMQSFFNKLKTGFELPKYDEI